MTKAAIINNGKVANIIVVDPTLPVSNFPGAVEVPDELPVAIGWKYSTASGFKAPQASTPDTAMLKDYAARKRYSIETSGVVVNGVVVDTSRGSQSMINGALAYLRESAAPSVSFKSNTGWVTLSVDQIKATALAVGDHVQACFSAECAVDAQIDRGDITSYAQIDGASWPTAGGDHG